MLAIQLKYDYDVTCVLLFRAWVDPEIECVCVCGVSLCGVSL